jgi:Tfp pilus assembly protein PilX
MFLNSPHFRNIIFTSRVDKAPGIPNRGRGGFALVFALAMLVLLMTIVLAYFSNAMLHRQISVASAANLKVQLITKTAADLILDDFQHEIEAGSQPDANSSLTMPVRRPISLTSNGIGVTNMLAPSVVPQRIGDGGVTNIVKVSRSGLSFFTNGTGYRALTNRASDGLARASSISTTNTSANGRYLTKERWLVPKLMSDSETNAFTVPDWIYLNRKGETPTDFTTSGLATAANSNSTNTGFVIGRYAYTIYDVGGLLDINVVGNALPSTNNAIRGLAHQVSLSNGIGGVSVPNFTNFVAWRSAVSSTNTNAASGSGGLFDPKRNFIDVPASEQAFVNRQDFLNYVAQSGSPIPSAALPFLTTFSRDLNAPSYEPNSSRSKLPASPDPLLMNPALLSVRFLADTMLHRPEGDITVKSGTPVVPRRFPLSKLSLFEQASPDAAAMIYYFGLTRVDSYTWRYTATTSDGRIAKLSEVAALGREPNFFEILQAVLITGSLGKSGVDTYTYDKARDSLQNLQVIQIGANIIDQWDANDFPTCLQFPSGSPGVYLSAYGVENLPYINQIGLVGWRPPDDRDLFQVWAVFDVWNPHQNAKTPPSGIDGFRIVPTGGAGRIILSYAPPVLTSQYATLTGQTAANGGACFTESQTSANNIVALNSGRNFSFNPLKDYSEPTTLGSTPTSKNDTPGLLIIQCTPNPAIAVPKAADRTPKLQITIAQLESDTGKTIGVKAYNNYRLKSNPIAPDWKGWEFALQAHKTGDPSTQWMTYQKFENFGLNQLDGSSSPCGGDKALTDLPTNTQFGEAGAPLTGGFYTWRGYGTTPGMIKVDPRTSRLGLSGWSQSSAYTIMPGNDFLGNSIRNLTTSLPATFPTAADTTVNNSLDWCFPGGVHSVGRTAPKILDPTFEVIPQFRVPAQGNRFQIGLYGLVANNPDLLNSDYPARYKDPDGEIRPGDGYFGALPTARGRFGDRPILLNRPFRSVGELGHVFRDIPWKTLDFSTRRSGDLGLLDVFTISETDGSSPLTAGKINLNTRQTSALAAALLNSSKQLAGVNASVLSSELSAPQAQTLAQAIVSESTARPFLDRGDLVSRVLNSGSGADPLAGDTSKVVREAAVRTLAEIGTSRTWNFMIDLVAQTGRFTTAAKSGSDFMVQSEERVWIHLAIDRMTGEVLELRKEVVNE